MGRANQLVGGPHLVRLLGGWRERGPAYGALASRIRALVLDGRLAQETRLPAERDLARTLGVSRTTVAAAYERLRGEGFLRSRQGAGSWTALPDSRRPAQVPWATLPADDRPLLDLTVAALPAPEAALAEAAAAATANLPPYLSGHGLDPVGLLEVRQVIAERYTRRGVATTPDQVLVTNGAQHAFQLILKLLTGPGDRVLVESPTFPNTLDAVRAEGGRSIPVGLTPTGWDLGLIETSLRQWGPALVYTIADFHNPTGHRMPDGDRAALVAAARRAGAHVVADETFAELALDDAPAAPAPLASFDTDGRVLSVGSLSKALWAGLRIGWVRATPPLIRRLAAVRAVADLAGPVLEQLMAARLFGSLEELLATRRRLLTGRRDALVAALRELLPAWTFRLPTGGMSLWMELDRPVSTVLTEAAERQGLLLVGGPRFGADGTLERFLRLPFTLPEATLREAVTRLAVANRALELGGLPVSRPPGWVT
jgi:DNA-binding transcriptional MocR family regulator